MSLPEHMLADWPVLLVVWALAAAGGWLTGRKLRQWLAGLPGAARARGGQP